MLSDKMRDALNDQINAEMYSAYIYLAMSAYFEEINLPGAANWMRIQQQEELAHAMKFYNYINERHTRIELKAIACPPKDWKSPLEAFQTAFAHEQMISGRINDLAVLASEEKDHSTLSFLKWFIDEQVEEESSVDNIVQKVKLVGNEGTGMYMIDQELAARVYTPPVGNET